jgi:putative transposase
MPRHLSRRQQAIAAYEQGEGTLEQLAARFRIDAAFLARFVRLPSDQQPPWAPPAWAPPLPRTPRPLPRRLLSPPSPPRYQPEHYRVPPSAGAYPSDLTDAEWEQIQPLLQAAAGRGRPPTQDRRRILDAIFYISRSGCQWRMLPHDYPPWQTVASCFYRWKRRGLLTKVYAQLRGAYRQSVGKQEQPSAGIIDSQSVKTTEKGGPVGFDGGKKVKGRKRHLFVDTLGLLLAVLVLPANASDGAGAKQMLEPVHGKLPRMQKLWVDGGYKEGCREWIEQTTGWQVEVTRQPASPAPGAPDKPGSEAPEGFLVRRWRWIVERTFGWMGRYRRLSKDYEATTSSAEAWIWISMSRLLLRRLARKAR